MTDTPITLQTGSEIPFDQLVDLYNAVGWLAYTNDEQRPKLQQALQNSTHVVTAWDGAQLIGLARCLSDEVAVCYLQDILVHPAYQRKGVGRKLMEHCLARFAHVRMQILLTDDEERQKLFYASLGFENTREIEWARFNVFVRFK